MFDDLDDEDQLDLIDDDPTKVEDEQEEDMLQMKCKKPTLGRVSEREMHDTFFGCGTNRRFCSNHRLT